jgi:hypothetical protein
MMARGTTAKEARERVATRDMSTEAIRAAETMARGKVTMERETARATTKVGCSTYVDG